MSFDNWMIATVVVTLVSMGVFAYIKHLNKVLVGLCVMASCGAAVAIHDRHEPNSANARPTPSTHNPRRAP